MPRATVHNLKICGDYSVDRRLVNNLIIMHSADPSMLRHPATRKQEVRENDGILITSGGSMLNE